MVTLPYLQQPFEIKTDASNYAIRAVLTQQGHLVEYDSDTLSDTVRKYPTYDKDMYSIVKAWWQWKKYILGKETVIRSDHRPLNSYKLKGGYRKIIIISGPLTCNNLIWTSSKRRETPIMLQNPSSDHRLWCSPPCSTIVGMILLIGRFSTKVIHNSTTHTRHSLREPKFHLQDALLCHLGHLCVPSGEHAKIIW